MLWPCLAKPFRYRLRLDGRDSMRNRLGRGKHMRDLLTNPLWQADDLGQPIPDSTHACSVALPLWEQVIRYEEEDPGVLERLQCGYPRFFCNQILRALFREVERELATGDEKILLFPSAKAAGRCADYIQERQAIPVHVHDLDHHNLYAVRMATAGFTTAMEYWRYSGEIVTSRQAQAALTGAARNPEKGHQARETIRRRLAGLAGQNPGDVFLFPSGMSAVFAVHRAVQHMFPGRKSAQLEFPYVDVLRIQKEFGEGVHFFPLAGTEESLQIGRILQQESLSAVFCELASNPLMRSADVETLHPIAIRHNLPIIVDDTIASSINIDAFQVADVVTSSLTKFFSGTSDVMAGSVILRHDSPFRTAFASFLTEEVNDTLWDDDAIALETYSRDYPERMRTINRHAETLFEFLHTRPEVEQIYYPKCESPDLYRQLLRAGGGYGGLISITLRDRSKTSPIFYNNLRVSKGPSLGTNFTLACPYTLLAHYRELEWAASCGCVPELIRISVGLESSEEMIGRFSDAFDSLGDRS